MGMTAVPPRSRIAVWHRLVSKAPSPVTVPICSSGGIWSSRWGRTGLSPLSLEVNSTARMSPVAVSIARCTLRYWRRRCVPCLRASHSPSPRNLIPVLSTSRFSGPGLRGAPDHVFVQPDQQRPAPHERIVVGLPVRRAVAGEVRPGHDRPLNPWVLHRNPAARGLLQRRRPDVEPSPPARHPNYLFLLEI